LTKSVQTLHDLADIEFAVVAFGMHGFHVRMQKINSLSCAFVLLVPAAIQEHGLHNRVLGEQKSVVDNVIPSP
jgi:hypothetical protein